MASTPPGSGPMLARVSAKDLITLACAIVGAAFVVAGAIRSDGQPEQRLQVVETEVSRMKQDADRRADLLGQIDVRTARIETKLEMITTARGLDR